MQLRAHGVSLVAACGVALAQAFPAREPGVWEVQVVTSGEGAQREGPSLDQRLASLPPERRAQVEALMKSRGVGQGDGTSTMTMRFCLTPQDVADDAEHGFYPRPERGASCEHRTVSRSASELRFSASCKREGKVRELAGRVYDVTSRTYAAEYDTATDRGAVTVRQRARWLYADCSKLK